MFGMTMSVVLYADPTKTPEPILLGGGDTDRVTEIQKLVGGHFDAVKRGCSDTTGANKDFILVGYVHDEGKLLDLPLNPLACVLFDEVIHGDVVIVSGTNPDNGDYDGESYDIPVAFSEYIIKAMHPTIVESVMFSKMLAMSVANGLKENIITREEYERIHGFMEEQYHKANSAYGSLEDMPEDIQALLKKCMKHTFLGGDE